MFSEPHELPIIHFTFPNKNNLSSIYLPLIHSAALCQHSFTCFGSNNILTFIYLFMVQCNIFKSFSWPFAVPFLYSPYPHRTLFNKLDDKNSTFLPQHYAQTIRLQNYITVRLHIIANKSFTKGSVQYPSQLYVTSGARLSYSTFSTNFRPQTVS